MKNTFTVSYITTLPKEGNAPRVTIRGTDIQTYRVTFHEYINGDLVLVSQGKCKTNQTLIAKVKQWYTLWRVTVYDEKNQIVFTDNFDVRDKVVFIKMDAYALGDTIAWIPYVELFRKKHNCKVICSTFRNEILVNSYPNIMFVKPNTVIDNVYAQYYIGASNDDNPYYSPIKVNENPLQDVAARTLGLRPMEVRPVLEEQIEHLSPNIIGKYVTLSEFGSTPNKEWKGDWQMVVNFFIERGYKVVVISKEKTNLNGVIDHTGESPLKDRMVDLKYAKMHLGVSSGLSWLAWGVGTHVVMISDVTPNFHEFQNGITRVNANKLNVVDYNVKNNTSTETLLNILNSFEYT